MFFGFCFYFQLTCKEEERKELTFGRTKEKEKKSLCENLILKISLFEKEKLYFRMFWSRKFFSLLNKKWEIIVLCGCWNYNLLFSSYVFVAKFLSGVQNSKQWKKSL